jgi:hypothetical protein
MGGEGEGWRREWVRRCRMSCWGGDQWILAQEKEGKSEGDKSRDEKIMMVKLIV